MRAESNTHVTSMRKLWLELYGHTSVAIFDELIYDIPYLQKHCNSIRYGCEHGWYKQAVVYALYVDFFAGTIAGLIEKLAYFENLGVNCLWLLPVLESPMKDGGFDVSDYRKIRHELVSIENSFNDFDNFIVEAHSRGIRIIFDVPVNHTSNQHYWFTEASKSENNSYRNYYIWSKDASEYSSCRLLFEGMCHSNWEPCGDSFYFHRFFEFQPDLNYKNPKVLCEMVKILWYWVQRGIDGFRLDAIPYLWKTEGTDCENLRETHAIVKFFRAAIDAVSPATLLLAEACQSPKEVVKYMGNGDECHAGYHFPLMPQIFKSLATGEAQHVVNILDVENTPRLPDDCVWFIFLRVHDELSLEKVYVNEEDRLLLHNYYCRRPEWDFRLGQGISARLSNLLNGDTQLIVMAFSIMLSLPGVPLIYYGDEFGRQNDNDYFEQRSIATGYRDSRNLVRGPIDWPVVEHKLKQSSSSEKQIFDSLRNMLMLRHANKLFVNGSIRFINSNGNVLSYERYNEHSRILFVHNLSSAEVNIDYCTELLQHHDMLGRVIKQNNNGFVLPAYSFYWLAYFN